MTATPTASTAASTFESLGVPAPLERALSERGITSPFPVQAATIPDALAGRDVSGRAPTGSGKTLAFGLPMLARVGDARPHHPRALILAPTRELIEQIKDELEPLAGAVDRSIVAVYGGVSYDPQRKALRNGVDVVAATPGRLGDLIERGDVELDEVDIIVIDEADRMADMGFLPDVRWLLNRTSRERQTLLFSATLDGDVAVLSHAYQSDPVRHEVEGEEDHAIDARHVFWRVEHTDRSTQAAAVVRAAAPTIVFCETRAGAERVEVQMKAQGLKVKAIHGGRAQVMRNKALAAFTEGRVDALIATDVAARGLHIEGVNSVVHFDPPHDLKGYLHRSGRTARAGASGVVVSLVRDDQRLGIQSIQRSLNLTVGLSEPDPDHLDEIGEKVDPAATARKPRRRRRTRSRNRI